MSEYSIYKEPNSGYITSIFSINAGNNSARLLSEMAVKFWGTAIELPLNIIGAPVDLQDFYPSASGPNPSSLFEGTPRFINKIPGIGTIPLVVYETPVFIYGITFLGRKHANNAYSMSFIECEYNKSTEKWRFPDIISFMNNWGYSSTYADAILKYSENLQNSFLIFRRYSNSIGIGVYFTNSGEYLYFQSWPDNNWNSDTEEGPTFPSKYPEIVPYDPFNPVDPSGPGDNPPGNFDDTSDPIPDSSLPTLSSANTGFTRIYNPTLAQVQSLASYLWTDATVIETIWNHIKQYFEDPMQAIIGFNLVPVPVPDGGTQEFKLMYIPTGVQMTVAASQFVDVDCGTLHLDPYYGSALDYAPNTKISCFLPYIGNVELNPDEIMNTTLQVKYRVDICSGSCVAKILVDGNVLYQYSGHCAINIPLSSADFSSYVSAAISVAKLGVGVAAAGALGAAGLEAAAVTQATSAAETVVRDSEGVVDWSKTTTRQSTRTSSPSPASYTGITPKNISNTVGQIMGAKPTFQHSGSFSGNTGYLGVRRPYLIVTRPNLCLPSSYQAMNGFPSMITMLLSKCQGFTQVQQLHFQGSSATNPEVDEILQLLKSGVVF